MSCIMCLALNGVSDDAEVSAVDLFVGGYVLGIASARAEHTQGFCPQRNLCEEHLTNVRDGVSAAVSSYEGAQRVAIQSPELLDFSLPGEGS